MISIFNRKAAIAACLAAGMLSLPFPARAQEVHVEYEDLRQLLIDGNLQLQEETDSYYTNLEDCQRLIDAMTEERDYMLLKKEQYEEDAAASGQYRQNASNLLNSITRLEKQLTRAKSSSGFLSTDKKIDSYTMSAQTLMNSYNQMEMNVSAKEKTVAAAQASHEAILLKYAAGAATKADVEAASSSLKLQQNQLASYRQQAGGLRFDLLSMLGITDGETVTIGRVPEPDLAAIDAVDFERDQEKAVGNSSSVQGARHTYAGTLTEKKMKSGRETEATGTVLADITDSYQQMLSMRTAYQAAKEAFSSAEADYRALQLKKQAGMLDTAGYLAGEASYLEALARQETAKMNLYQAYENYKWEVKGVGF